MCWISTYDYESNDHLFNHKISSMGMQYSWERIKILDKIFLYNWIYDPPLNKYHMDFAHGVPSAQTIDQYCIVVKIHSFYLIFKKKPTDIIKCKTMFIEIWKYFSGWAYCSSSSSNLTSRLKVYGSDARDYEKCEFDTRARIKTKIWLVN